jgi:hypothetical protein
MINELKAALPTTLPRWMLGLLVPTVPALFFLPSYFPPEVWAIQSLSQLQARLLLSVSAVLLCTLIAFVSVIRSHKKIKHEFEELKKHMKI